jgi:serine protease DegQ
LLIELVRERRDINALTSDFSPSAAGTTGYDLRMRAAPLRRALTASMLAGALVIAGCTDDDGNDAAENAENPLVGGIAQLVADIEPSVVSVAVAAPVTGGPGGAGSGVIVRSEGVIVTNAHVVGDAEEVEVMLADGVRLTAIVEARDQITDLAVLRVDRQDLPAAVFAEGYPDVGDLAVAVGNPLGFDNTVTAGIISGLQRSLPDAVTAGTQALVDLIQTDAAISPGNSGGALVNAEGEVVGITVAYIPPAVGAVSLGFAIPSPTVEAVVDSLLADGTVSHAYVGVQAIALTPQIVERFGVPVARGIIVMEVEPDSPAARADVRPGDVITEIDGTPVGDVGQFLTQLRQYRPGESVVLDVVREGDSLELTVDLGERPAP